MKDFYELHELKNFIEEQEKREREEERSPVYKLMYFIVSFLINIQNVTIFITKNKSPIFVQNKWKYIAGKLSTGVFAA